MATGRTPQPPRPGPEAAIGAGKFTEAQRRELLAALKVHPAPYPGTADDVLRRLRAAGLMVQTAGAGHALTAVGLSHATEMAAKLLIERTGTARMARSPPPVSGPPAVWPFPESFHRW